MTSTDEKEQRANNDLHSTTDTSDIAKSASYLDLHLKIDSEVRFKNETL
jgi:hypothetical protein